MKASGGFTLIEMLIVIGIIGVLAAVMIPNLLAARTLAQKRAEYFYVSSVYKAANAYRAENVLATSVPNTDCNAVGGYVVGGYGTAAKPFSITACTVSSNGQTVTYSGLSGSSLTFGQ